MKIWERIILGFVSVIVVMIIVDVSALMNNIEIINRVDDLGNSKRIEFTQSNKVAFLIQRVKSNLRELFLELDIQERPQEVIYSREQIETHVSELQSAMKILRSATETGYLLSEDEEEMQGEQSELAIIDSLEALVPMFISDVRVVLNSIDEAELTEAENSFENGVESASRKIQNFAALLVDDAEEEITWAIQQLNRKVERAIKLGVYLTILSILLSLAIGFFIARSISGPLHKLISGTKEIGKGNLEAKVDLDTKGELQLLAQSFNDMADELKKRIESINNLNEELEEANQTKDKYFSIIAHDLRSPFNAILGFTDLLVENYKDFDEEKRQRIIRELNHSSKVVYELLENLLNWSRSQSGKIELLPQDLPLKLIINNSIESYSGIAKQKHIAVESHIQDEINVYADEFTITVVVNNILNNALKFTPDGGTVSVAANKIDDKIEVVIKDTGTGIKKEIIENLFRSKTIESTPGTRQEKGTGLGLILIKDFVEKNSGELLINSVPGKGSEFKFVVPAGGKMV